MVSNLGTPLETLWVGALWSSFKELTGDEPPLLGFENERTGGRPSELRDLFHVAKAERGFPSFVELHKEPRSLPAECFTGMIVLDHFVPLGETFQSQNIMIPDAIIVASQGTI